MKRFSGWVVMGGLAVLLTWIFLAGLTRTMRLTIADEGKEEGQVIVVRADMAPEKNQAPQHSEKNQDTHRVPVPKEKSPAVDSTSSATLRSPSLESIREAYQRTGGAVHSHVPPIRSEASSLEEYLAFSKAAGFRFVLFAKDRADVTEISFDEGQPTIDLSPSINFHQYAKQGRLIQDSKLVEMARALATEQGLSEGALFALVPKAFDEYVSGKILTILHDEGLAPESVRWVEIKLSLKGALPGLMRPTLNVLRVIHQGGASVPHDPEM